MGESKDLIVGNPDQRRALASSYVEASVFLWVLSDLVDCNRSCRGRSDSSEVDHR